MWGEVKRHRTVPQQVQSIHQAAEKANATFALYEDLIAPGKLDEQTVIIIGEVMAIPASVKANPDYLLPLLTCAKEIGRAHV